MYKDLWKRVAIACRAPALSGELVVLHGKSIRGPLLTAL